MSDPVEEVGDAAMNIGSVVYLQHSEDSRVRQ
jgi:hypothetical protein